ncbi:hypothetical protein Rt10032_c18g6114 [Rhodotorula toruloides]|uniref:SPOR domain-containing protein n=1 Tax=Rhodotorula toruloides TaxID=5286 RepID=A0A511KNZ6_RHOTO|nr:hypothetical protein Rt10032_c18g6114 [Rhodotorula toruloides]
MRILALFAALCALLFTLALAEPAPALKDSPALAQPPRRAVAWGRAADERKDTGSAKKADGADGNAVNYLVTLDRSITNVAKDKIIDALLRMGAVVKQEYNYRVYKGVLFSIPLSRDKGLTAWETALTKQEGVKYVEKDQEVRANSS